VPPAAGREAAGCRPAAPNAGREAGGVPACGAGRLGGAAEGRLGGRPSGLGDRDSRRQGLSETGFGSRAGTAGWRPGRRVS